MKVLIACEESQEVCKAVMDETEIDLSDWLSEDNI